MPASPALIPLIAQSRRSAPCENLCVPVPISEMLHFCIISYSKLPFSQSATAPLPLFALLLFSEPSELTLRTLFALPGFGDRSHQLRAVLIADPPVSSPDVRRFRLIVVLRSVSGLHSATL